MKSCIEDILARIAEGMGTESDAETLRREMQALLSALLGMCIQHGIWNERGEVCSGGLGADAEAMELLASHGRFEVLHEAGRHVRGTFSF